MTVPTQITIDGVPIKGITDMAQYVVVSSVDVAERVFGRVFINGKLVPNCYSAVKFFDGNVRAQCYCVNSEGKMYWDKRIGDVARCEVIGVGVIDSVASLKDGEHTKWAVGLFEGQEWHPVSLLQVENGATILL